MPLSTQVGYLATRIAQEVKLKAIASRQIIAGTGLTGGGDLTADRTLAVAYGTAASTATQGNDTRVTYDAPVLPTLNSAKFTTWSTSAAPGFQGLRMWRQGRTAYAQGLIKNTVDLAFGSHIIIASGGIPAALRPKATPWPGGTAVGVCAVLERACRLDIGTGGDLQIAVGATTITSGQNMAINISWPLD